MTEPDPKWGSGDPATNLETYWRAIYQITGAPAVVVNEFCRSEKIAKAAAEEALGEALKKVIELKLPVSAACWTVKHQSRRQTRTFPAENRSEYVTQMWGGVFTQVLKSLTEKGQQY